MFKEIYAAAIVISGATTAMAAIPSPMLLGTQRVVIACEPVAGLAKDEHRAFCTQLVRKAATLTDLPVSLASAADLDPTNLARQAKQLLLRVTGTATPVDSGRKSVALIVDAVRAARPIARDRTAASSVALVKIEKEWVLQGRIQAFEKALAPTRRRGLHAPLTAD